MHLAAAVVALATGFIVAVIAKGSGVHRVLGQLYFFSMMAVNATALMIYDLFGGFGPFHFAALVSGVTVVLGFIAVRRRKPNWMAAHAYWMTWSYVGLVAAAVSEVSTRYLDFDFGLTVGAATLLVVAAGSMLINRNVPRILRTFGVVVGK